MYTISKGPDGIVLVCHDCSHVERIDGFDKRVGSQRTQAARATQVHSREQHGLGSVLKPCRTTTESWHGGRAVACEAS
jgi:hypothetical protein